MPSVVDTREDYNCSQHEELVVVAHRAPMKCRAMSFSAHCGGTGRGDWSRVWLLSAGHSGELL